MKIASLLVFSFFSQTLLLQWALGKHQSQKSCPNSFTCGKIGLVIFPFTNFTKPSCGLCQLNCAKQDHPQLQLDGGEGKWYPVLHMWTANVAYVDDPELKTLLSLKSCRIFQKNMTLPNSTFVSYKFYPDIYLLKCYSNSSDDLRPHDYFNTDKYYNYSGCRETQNFSIYYSYPVNFNRPAPPTCPPNCSIIRLPLSINASTPDNPLLDPTEPPHPKPNASDIFSLLTSQFSIELNVSADCLDCHNRWGQCKYRATRELHCHKEGKQNKWKTVVILVTVIPGVLILTICLLVVILRRRQKWGDVLSFLSRNTSSDPSSNPDQELGSVFFGVPVFSYAELEEATNNFDPSKELGDGGFGTVYHGILRDGREVAVKRLYEHNYKRVAQFMNEIEILTRLRHKNLVSLYGCTSRRSRELILVYEYIPNGTVADHLHGDRANSSPIPWPVRMNIAIETATALAYLHASDIIHRDVKTNNILLDSNFCVKVADFGLSRLFPNDVTHVSTAPQGTPGYVDPEYHQCYQLTNKSDVYSFGVVLVELISSMPAVDITRHRHEINLANLAVNRIQRCAFDELIDSSLGFESDPNVNRMTTSVAELAFRCLQLEKELRPTMGEVLEVLLEINNVERTESEGGSQKWASRGGIPPLSPESEDVVLLKNTKFAPSPNSVVEHVWISSGSATTTATTTDSG